MGFSGAPCSLGRVIKEQVETSVHHTMPCLDLLGQQRASPLQLTSGLSCTQMTCGHCMFALVWFIPNDSS